MPGGVPSFRSQNADEVDAAAQERWDVSDLRDDKTLQSDQFVGVMQIQSDKSTKFAPGFGFLQREYAEGWADLDMQVADDASGTNAADFGGKYRWEVYTDSDKENLARASGTFSASELRTSVAASRTDKTVMAGKVPVVPEDGFLVLAARPKAAQDGQVVYAEGSSVDVGIPYSKFKI